MEIYLRKTGIPFLLILIIFFNIGCRNSVTNELHNSDETNKGVLVKTIELKKKEYSYTQSFSGIVKPFDRVDIGFKISGRVDKILFDEGDDMVKGDAIAMLEKDELEASLRQAQASYDKAKSSYNRNKKLLTDGTISPSEIETSEAEYKIKEAALDLSRMQLENSTIFAPISGKLAFRSIEEKEVVLLNKTYFTIMNISDIILEIGVPEYQISKLFAGQKTIASVEAYPLNEFKGEIYKVAMATDDYNKLFKVEIKIHNSQELLKPGMIAKVEIETNTFTDIYLIPLNAIRDSNGDKYVYLARNGIAVKKILKDYYIHHNNVILLNPLDEEDRLVIKGHKLLNDGVKVYEHPATGKGSATN
ncbi:MAG: efflux RND transporter periplasmic adaptor subunit [Candidatus Anammoxibacter sp.]